MKGLIPGMMLAVSALSVSAQAAQTYGNNDYTQYAALTAQELEDRRMTTEDSYEAPMGQLFDEAKYLAGETWLHQFENIIVINKKAKGPGAQTIRFYTNGRLVISSKVSTGLENIERVGVLKAAVRWLPGVRGTTTPHWRHTSRGFYTIKRVENVNYKSSESEFKMPYAMFFNDKRGLAVHQVPPEIEGGNSLLGKRASSGCVRVHQDTAQRMNFAVRNSGKGMVPVIDSRTGRPVTDANGQVKYQMGWKSIVIVEEY